MKKILFIIPCVPYPLNSGGNQAFFQMVDYIRHKMSVSVLFYAWTIDEAKRVEKLKDLWGNVDFYTFVKETKEEPDSPLVRNPFYYKGLKKLKTSIERKMRRQLLSMSNGTVDLLKDKDFVREKSVLPNSIYKEFDTRYIDYVTKVAHAGFDIIQVEFYELIALGYVLPQNVQTIFVHHELRYIRNENEMNLFQAIRPSDRMNFLVAKDFEWNALQKYKHIIALTEVDRLLLANCLGREEHIYASPAVIKFESNSETEFIPCVHRRFTFVGYGEHFPNLDAVVWLCKEIVPYLRKCNFEFTLQVVGMGYEYYSAELRTACPEIELVGFVENLTSFLQGSIALVPIRIGSGMRMKILVMVSSNVPFITTSKGLEGIHFSDGVDCLIADNTVDFADAMIKLSNDLELQKMLVHQANEKMKNMYNPQEMLDRRLSVYTSILKDEF